VAKWAGRGAAFSHETAAELSGLVDAPTDPVHITIPASRRLAAVDGVVVHLSPRVVGVTHPSREPPRIRIEETVLDLANRAKTSDQAVDWAVRACQRRLTTADRVAEALADRRKIRWRAELIGALVDVETGCHSLLELRYFRDVERAHRLPNGHRQVARRRAGGRWYDDVQYARYRVRVELDGRLAHRDEKRWRDMWRDNATAVDGEVVLRYGWTDVARRPCAVAVQVAAVLVRRGWVGWPGSCGGGCEIIERAL
jgi:very-short-patch-repair endonuclease